MNNKQSGFTIPELIVAILLTAMFSTIIMMVMFEYWRSSYTLQGDLDTMVSRMNASDFFREYIGSSSGLINQNGIPDQHPGLVDDSISPANYWLPIHATPSTTNVSGNGITPLIYFKKYSIDNSGNVAMNGVSPYEDEFIFYIDHSTKTLRLRSLANPAVANNKLQTSCPDQYVTNLCPKDKIVLEDVSSISLRYFSRAGNLINYTSSTDPDTGNYNGPDYPLVEVAEVTFDIAKKTVFQKTNSIINSTTVRVALRNT